VQLSDLGRCQGRLCLHPSVLSRLQLLHVSLCRRQLQQGAEHRHGTDQAPDAEGGTGSCMSCTCIEYQNQLLLHLLLQRLSFRRRCL
jgi:hypothetical protein